ncbi:MAG: SPOR domain-containing protein [Halobacteriovoraceae bacterium]|nr:SPOR domain-containing protein [Halobacteriovoraceae bacterium]
MNEKTKLFIFDRVEVILIFLFMIMIAITSFVFGVRVGKKIPYAQAGLTQQDRMTIEMKSKEEERVEKVLEDEKQKIQKSADIGSQLEHKLIEEMKKVGEGRLEKEVPQVNNMKEEIEVETPSVTDALEKFKNNSDVNQQSPVDNQEKENKELSGKYTIQLASYKSYSDAEEFAQSYKMLGYSPIINEVELEGKGTWFRVSLGAFESINEAKKFIVDKKSLFTGSKYTISTL